MNSLCLPKRFQRAGQLHAAAVHHGHLIAVAHQVGNRARAARQQRRSFKARSAELDDILHSEPLRLVPAQHHV